jgi:Arc/MetJ-type ribon-helix-helix transcriptional regulator
MGKVIVNCGFSEQELALLDQLVIKGVFCNRSDAIRGCTQDYLIRKGYK